jgi:predicted PolB exonuclease-like 3'-5' exonuclease
MSAPIYATQNTARREYLVFDIETAARAGVERFIPEPAPPGNVKDPVKVAAAIEAKRAEQIDKLPLDMNLNRIVTISFISHEMKEPMTLIALDEDEEREALAYFFSKFAPAGEAHNLVLVGFCIKGFDIPVCLQRARLLGMEMPRLNLAKWSNPHIHDIQETINFDGMTKFGDSGVMPRRLKNYADLFGCPAFDDCDGKDVAELLAAGDIDGVKKHCEADVYRTKFLAEMLGVIK